MVVGSHTRVGSRSRGRITVLILGFSLLSDARFRVSAAEGPADLDWGRTFHATFDEGPDANLALGDRTIHTLPSMDPPRVAREGLPDGVRWVPSEGRRGGALRFDRATKEVVCFAASRNLSYRPKDWNGSAVLWLRVSPDADIPPGYCDPLQITPRSWNDGAFFVDFSKDEVSRHFRLGAFPDRSVWDPTLRDWEAVPVLERPMVVNTAPPFSRDRWTQVVFTFHGFNSDGAKGTANFYLDGVLQGKLTNVPQRWTWDISETWVFLGINYVGWMDDLTFYNRALSASEVAALHRRDRPQ
jgi:hypothetical protein